MIPSFFWEIRGSEGWLIVHVATKKRYDGRIWKEVKMEDNTPDKFKTTWGQVLESRDKSSVKRV